MRITSRTLAAIAVCAACAGPASAAVDLPGGSKLETVDFERHIMGLLSKTGCNLGSCHGSFQGKNGFRLSLFGFEPAFDYAALTRDNLGRRVDRQHPENSLVLTKGAGAMPHDGGMRFGRGSWTYNVFREWIKQGAKWSEGSGAITKLEVNPVDFAVLKIDTSLQLAVTATFADGSKENITPFCDFRISDDAIATVTPLGVLTALKPGDAGLTVLYRGAVRAVRVLVPAPGQVTFPNEPADNIIDKEVTAKLKLMNMAPSGISNDVEFLRRVTIDTTGVLPTPDEVRAFLADQSPDKRTRKIDELLAHPLHAALWATKLSDITGNNTEALETPNQLKVRRSQLWHDWLRKRVADNTPYDVIVHDILTATSRDGQSAEEWMEFVKKLDIDLEKKGRFQHDYADKKTLDLFWRRQGNTPVEIWGEKVAAAFLGVRLECAQCHKHPTDRWTQDDYWGFANVFAPVAIGFSERDVQKLATEETNKRRKALEDAGVRNPNNVLNTVREMYFGVGDSRRQTNERPIPMTNRVVSSRTLGGPALPHTRGVDTREKLWQWMREPSNPFFSRSFVNRVWAHYFGVGLVNPVDDFSQANPPTNPRLLDGLAKEFVESGFDIRRLERAVLLSRAYQRTSIPNASNKFDKNNFARSYVRPLMAEQVVDVLNSAIGVEEKFGDLPGAKMTEIGASNRLGDLSYLLKIFGRPPRTTACDCERGMEPALPQTLFRMTDPTLVAKLTAKNNRANKLATAKNMNDEEAVDELFLAALTRFPTETEKAEAVKYIRAETSRADAMQEVLWALINTREFILNH